MAFVPTLNHLTNSQRKFVRTAMRNNPGSTIVVNWSLKSWLKTRVEKSDSEVRRLVEFYFGDVRAEVFPSAVSAKRRVAECAGAFIARN